MERDAIIPRFHTFVVAAALLAVSFPGPAAAQKQGGILRVHVIDSPPSVSMHEEAAPEPGR